jgi:hypothetical protein
MDCSSGYVEPLKELGDKAVKGEPPPSMDSYHISGGSVIIGESLIGMEKGNRLDHQDDDGYDCGVHVFEAKGGLDALRAIRPIKIMNKEYDQETVLRELAADREDAFYMVDLSIVLAKLGKWRNLMPRVKVSS